MQRAQLVLVIAAATRTFVPAVNPAAPVVPAALPSLETFVQPAGAVLVQAPVAQPSSGVGSAATVAAFALAGVAAAATVSSLRRGRPTMAAEGEAPAAEEAPAERSSPIVMEAPAPPAAALAMDGGKSEETFGKIWDPLDLANLGSEKTLNFFRHAELKHGRVAMAAMVGFLVHINKLYLPGEIGQGVTFQSLSEMGPFEAWSGIPMLGQIQILFTIAGIEWSSESKNPDGHYMAGGTPGDLKFLKTFWDPIGFTKRLSPEELARKRNAELKNGRLAMIGIISLVAATNIQGSVPLLANAPLLTGPGLVLPLVSTAPMA